ncbi:MAG: hypothetical protein KME30_30770 [Iphinoe sp. HA4291-MV1]|nr:hypothetical protein [Iphinoe sp. HA4291-MV1]
MTIFFVLLPDSLGDHTEYPPRAIASSSIMVNRFAAFAMQVDALTIPVDALTIPVDALTIPVDALTIPVDALTIPADALTIPADALTIPADALTIPADALTMRRLAPLRVSASSSVSPANLRIRSRDDREKLIVARTYEIFINI